MGNKIGNPVLYAQLNPDRLVIQDLERRFTTYQLKEIYKGEEEVWRLFVPNVDDKVEDWLTNTVYRVTAVDDRTKLSTLVLVGQLAVPFPGQNEEIDPFEGIDPTWSYDTYRVLINYNTMPATMNIDRRYRLYGSDVRRIGIFKGGLDGELISAQFDNSGKRVSDYIECQLVQMANGVNKAVWAPREGYCVKPVEDFEVLYIVGYGDGPQPLSVRRMQARLTDYVRAPDQGTKYILENGVRLKSTWLNQADPMLLELPINVTLDSLDLMAEVTYSDGSKKEWPVTGNKVVLDGLDVFTSRVVNAKHPLGLHYYLDNNEESSYALPGLRKHISVGYTLRTKDVVGSYSVKFFVYPQWVSEAVGYKLLVWMYSADRKTFYNITDKIAAATNSPAFSPKRYGQEQEFALSVYLDEVDISQYKRVRVTQTIRLTLLQAGTQTAGDFWTVQFSSGSTPTQWDTYGRGVKALFSYDTAGNSYVELANGHSDLDRWLDTMFYNTHPLYIEKTEVRAPKPTHFEIMLGANVIKRLPIALWNQKNNIPGGTGQESGNLYVRWIQVLNGVDLHLGISGVVISKVA